MATTEGTDSKVRLSVEMEKSIKDEFIKLAKANNTDSSKLIRNYVAKYIANNKKKEK